MPSQGARVTARRSSSGKLTERRNSSSSVYRGAAFMGPNIPIQTKYKTKTRDRGTVDGVVAHRRRCADCTVDGVLILRLADQNPDNRRLAGTPINPHQSSAFEIVKRPSLRLGRNAVTLYRAVG